MMPGPSADSSIAAPCRLRIVSTPAQPGATALRPPEKPAIRCGSIRPVTIFRSAPSKPRSSQISVPRAVRPRWTCWLGVARDVIADAIARDDVGAGHLRQLVGACWRDAARWRRGSRCARARCRRARASASSGGSTMPYGTGRVLSEMTTTASRRPRAISASGAVPIGCASAAATPRAGSASGAPFDGSSTETAEIVGQLRRRAPCARSRGESSCASSMPETPMTDGGSTDVAAS